jgi:dTDP-4-dehydrorhamnose 3,5-epimerase
LWVGDGRGSDTVRRPGGRFASGKQSRLTSRSTAVPELPALLDGNRIVDDRGAVSFVNDFSFDGVKRFYVVSNHRQGFVRAWHAHRREAKYVTVVSGSALVGAVAIDDWETPSPHLTVHRYVLTAGAPRVLFIPPGYGNGFMSLTADAQVLFFSTATLDESRADDVRYPARYWDIWTVDER